VPRKDHQEFEADAALERMGQEARLFIRPKPAALLERMPLTRSAWIYPPGERQFHHARGEQPFILHQETPGFAFRFDDILNFAALGIHGHVSEFWA